METQNTSIVSLLRIYSMVLQQDVLPGVSVWGSAVIRPAGVCCDLTEKILNVQTTAVVFYYQLDVGCHRQKRKDINNEQVTIM